MYIKRFEVIIDGQPVQAMDVPANSPLCSGSFLAGIFQKLERDGYCSVIMRRGTMVVSVDAANRCEYEQALDLLVRSRIRVIRQLLEAELGLHEPLLVGVSVAEQG